MSFKFIAEMRTLQQLQEFESHFKSAEIQTAQQLQEFKFGFNCTEMQTGQHQKNLHTNSAAAAGVHIHV
jgi:hypothetical protein